MELTLFEQKYQKQFTEKQKEKILELRELKRKMIDELGILNFHEKIIIPLSKKLIKENSDINNCYLFHVLIGSSKKLEECVIFNLKEDKSIIKQLKKYEENIQ